MDLAIGARRVWVMMTLFAKDGAPKIVPECTYPLTGLGCIDRVYTDLGTFEVTAGGIRARELHGITAEELETRLGGVLSSE
jgi:3-oxoadipate CoA-transferase beta subunit